jgi:hypothetical protein
MSTPAPIAATPQTQQPYTANKRPLTLEQESFVRDATQFFGIEPTQVTFSDEKLRPTFDFEALCLIGFVLAPEYAFSVLPGVIREDIGLVTALCEMTPEVGRPRTLFASALIGEVMPEGGTVAGLKQSLDVARSRALRTGLRAIGCDPVKAIKARAESESQPLDLKLSSVTDDELYMNDLASIHLYARECGLINEETGNKREYYALMKRLIGVDSSREMTDLQRSQWATALRALAKAKQSATPKAINALRANAEAAQ